MGGGNKSGRTSPGDHSFLLHRLSRWAGGARSLGAPAASLPGRLASGNGGMERVRKDYEQMRRVLLGREPASAPVAILRAASANPTDGARAAGGYSLAALVAAAASTGSMPTTLRLFAVKADGMYPAAPKLEALAALAKAALSQSGAAVQPLKGSYCGACLAALEAPMHLPSACDPDCRFASALYATAVQP